MIIRKPAAPPFAERQAPAPARVEGGLPDFKKIGKQIKTAVGVAAFAASAYRFWKADSLEDRLIASAFAAAGLVALLDIKATEDDEPEGPDTEIPSPPPVMSNVDQAKVNALLVALETNGFGRYLSNICIGSQCLDLVRDVAALNDDELKYLAKRYKERKGEGFLRGWTLWQVYTGDWFWSANKAELNRLNDEVRNRIRALNII